MKTKEELRNELREMLEKAGAIADRAIKANDRTLSVTERAEVQKLFEHAKVLKDQIKNIKSDEDLLQQLKDLGNDVGSKTLEGWRSVAHTDSRWSQAFFEKGLSPHGAKDLTPSGTVLAPTAFDPEVHTEGDLASENLLRRIIPNGPPISGDTFTYWRQTLRQTAAAAVAAGAKKPESVYEATKIEDSVKTIAHLSEPLNRNDLSDSQALREFIDSELRLGLLLTVDEYIISGNPAVTPEEPQGLGNLAGVQAQAWDTDLFFTARKAKTKVTNALAVPSHFALNEADWERIELSRDLEERFHAGGPFAGGPRTLWSVPVVTSPSVPVGVGYVGPFRTEARVYQREEARIDWSENLYDPNALGAGLGASDFETNKIRFRAEERMAVAWLRPFAFVEMDLTAA